MTETIIQRSLAISQTRENQVQNYWRVGSIVTAAAGVGLIMMSLTGQLAPDAVVHGIAALAIAALAAYIGFTKHVKGSVGVIVARAFGVAAAAYILAGYVGFVPALAAVETTLVTATGAVALYVGFTPQ